MADRYFVCMCCGHMMTDTEHFALKAAIPCPTCNAAEQFGPCVYVPGFKGYTAKLAAVYAHRNRERWDGKRWPDRKPHR